MDFFQFVPYSVNNIIGSYNCSLIILSYIIAVFASYLALNMTGKLHQAKTECGSWGWLLGSAFAMGAGIWAMHFIGMLAFKMPIKMFYEPILTIISLVIAILTAGFALFLLKSTRYIVQNQTSQVALHQEKEFLKGVLNSIADGVIACDKEGQILFFNDAARIFYNLPLNTAAADINRYLIQLDKDTLPLLSILQGKKIHRLELNLANAENHKYTLLADGKLIHSEQNEKLGAVLALHDITERKKMEAQLRQQAMQDALTGLPNRILLMDRIEQAISQAKRLNTLVAILFFDLDRFKTVNDGLGHNIGDSLLTQVAERFKKNCRENDTVARLGGDEFVMVFNNLEDEQAVIIAAQRTLHEFEQAFILEDREFKISASIGVSIYPKNGIDADTLLKNADAAMYRAKERGRNNIQFYNDSLTNLSIARIELENDLHRAIDAKEFVLHYQPLVDTETGLTIGAEALIRWQHPQHGLIAPLDFIPLAEETGLIVAIGEWVLRTACAQVKLWQDQGAPKIKIAVNISSIQLKQQNLAELVANILQETGLTAEYLELELTESSIIDNADAILEVMRQLKQMGVHLVIDDFGTGYSSLSYLKRFPVDKLKIDRSFMQDVTTDPDNAAIVLAVIAMANSLKLKVLAEGTETESQLSFLHMHNCNEIQGYYFSKPLPAADFLVFLFKNYQLMLPA